jgi:NAD(P)-dependent dehydrogenase (short-subunit alcohol dehydrogenase family)
MGESERARSVLVTGAGSGIGRAIAERLARRGYRVAGTVRDPGRARDLTEQARRAGRPLRYLALEITSAEQVAAAATAIESEGPLDVLVHNAGAGVFGAVEEVDADLTLRQFAVNLFGPLDLTRRLLPALRAAGGQIIWIGSLAGRISLPFQAHYSATKSAVAAVSDALRMELRPFGVRVTSVEPGDFATNFTAARTIVGDPRSPYWAAHDRCLRRVEAQERGGPDPGRVAAAVERLCTMRRPPARMPVGPGAGATCLLLRLLPDRVRELVVRRHYGV